jgi:hypothetical protein
MVQIMTVFGFGAILAQTQCVNRKRFCPVEDLNLAHSLGYHLLTPLSVNGNFLGETGFVKADIRIERMP